MRGRDVDRVRAHAAHALGMLGDSRALAPLTKALQDGSVSMRMNAAMGLGELGDPEGLTALRQARWDPD
ncbi:MAG: HEAT repeat domain-containing protein, partial [Gemmatimonadota bacterium]